MNLISQANATLVGIGSLIEKPFEVGHLLLPGALMLTYLTTPAQGGRELLSTITDVPIVSLALINKPVEGEGISCFEADEVKSQ